MTLIVFLLLAGAALWVGLNRGPGEVTLAEATRWTVFYVAVAAVFAAFVLVWRGPSDAVLFATGYALEKALSVDNLLVFGLVFAHFGIKTDAQFKVLRWGVLGAVVFRLLFVLLGVGSLWLFGRLAEAAFAAVVGYSAVKVLRGGESGPPEDLDTRWYMRAARWVSPTIGPLVLCGIAIEFTDVAFAFDSVPTVIAVTRDPVLIWSAMVFAILGLRAMYFVLAALRRYLAYLDKAVAAVLVFVAAKLAAHALVGFEVGPLASLSVVLLILGVGVAASLRAPKEATS